MPSAEVVREALKVVEDPEIGINVVDLGLVYEVRMSEEGDAHIVFTLT
ncbi:MAG: metal-sulfur cluster assembly factor, partial [Actinomycetota bacterium]